MVIKSFLNPEDHQNFISGSKVTAILLKGCNLTIGMVELHWEGSAPAACAARLFYRMLPVVRTFQIGFKIH